MSEVDEAQSWIELVGLFGQYTLRSYLLCDAAFLLCVAVVLHLEPVVTLWSGAGERVVSSRV